MWVKPGPLIARPYQTINWAPPEGRGGSRDDGL
jgi:hypothetical protein